MEDNTDYLLEKAKALEIKTGVDRETALRIAAINHKLSCAVDEMKREILAAGEPRLTRVTVDEVENKVSPDHGLEGS
jgi:hypothetical protein